MLWLSLRVEMCGSLAGGNVGQGCQCDIDRNTFFRRGFFTWKEKTAHQQYCVTIHVKGSKQASTFTAHPSISKAGCSDCMPTSPEDAHFVIAPTITFRIRERNSDPVAWFGLRYPSYQNSLVHSQNLRAPF